MEVALAFVVVVGGSYPKVYFVGQNEERPSNRRETCYGMNLKGYE